MKGKLRGAVLCTAASALALGLSLTSCSRGGPDNGAGGQNAAEAATPGPTPPAQSASDANARALLKRMSDYLAAQNNIAMSYDSIFEVVSDGHEKFQIATS